MEWRNENREQGADESYQLLNIMLFGKKDTFAIEVYLKQIGRYIFANYCLWIKNSRIGDLSQFTLLSSIIDLIELFFSAEGERENYNIDESNYCDITERFITEYIEDMNSYKFNIGSFHDECLQGYYIFLIENTGYELLLIKDDIANIYLDAKIPQNIVSKCFKELKNWINESTVLVLRSYLDTLENKSNFASEGNNNISQ
ncbi:MAG: hypothetical protein J1E58_09320 [Prevotella sp.]|nr:hypothetical protein [Prevotella sp.]